MKKLFLPLLFLLLSSACSLSQSDLSMESQVVVSPAEDVVLQEKLLDQAELNCATIGESPSNFSFSSGKEVEGRKACCPGLEEINISSPADETGVCATSLGGSGICAPCGDGVCDEEYENVCNCAKDCLF
jgi:hypothetical protein